MMMRMRPRMHIMAAIMAAGLAGCATVQSTSTGDAPFFALSVADIEATKAWYSTMLGASVIAEGERPAPNGKSALLRSGNSLIEIQEREDSSPLHPMTDGIRDSHLAHGVFKIGFRVDDIDQRYAEMEAKGASFAHGIVDAHPDLGLRTFTILDPEGNMVQFFGE